MNLPLFFTVFLLLLVVLGTPALCLLVMRPHVSTLADWIRRGVNWVTRHYGSMTLKK